MGHTFRFIIEIRHFFCLDKVCWHLIGKIFLIIPVFAAWWLLDNRRGVVREGAMITGHTFK